MGKCIQNCTRWNQKSVPKIYRTEGIEKKDEVQIPSNFNSHQTQTQAESTIETPTLSQQVVQQKQQSFASRFTKKTKDIFIKKPKQSFLEVVASGKNSPDNQIISK
jgi:hypothetical protein